MKLAAAVLGLIGFAAVPSIVRADDSDIIRVESVCTRPVRGATNIWTHYNDWHQLAFMFTDTNANWISPMAPRIRPQGGFADCLPVPTDKKAILVSSFTLGNDTDYILQTLFDNFGTLRIWKDHDSSKEVVELDIVDKNFDARKVVLEAGEYSVVAEVFDTGGASGVLFSLNNLSGAVMSHTDGNWQGFIVPRNFDTTQIPH